MDELGRAVLGPPQGSGQSHQVPLGVGLDHASVGPKPAGSHLHAVLLQVHIEQAPEERANPPNQSPHHHRMALGQAGQRRKWVEGAKVLIPERQKAEKIADAFQPALGQTRCRHWPGPCQNGHGLVEQRRIKRASHFPRSG